MFWYFYPSKSLGTIEFENKWIKEWLPRGAFKKDPIFGWEDHYESKEIHAVHFKTDVSIYFQSYEMSVSNIQASSVYELEVDEEIPVEHIDEMLLRISSPSVMGYFNMVFTATLAQPYWRNIIEGNDWPEAFKQQISMYDCLEYEDGSPSPWTVKHIKEIEAKCKNKN